LEHLWEYLAYLQVVVEQEHIVDQLVLVDQVVVEIVAKVVREMEMALLEP
tara:strand:+ start:422 stop:571 length:150 start_codon:yes stop_codon:yes gene_type:complete